MRRFLPRIFLAVIGLVGGCYDAHQRARVATDLDDGGAISAPSDAGPEALSLDEFARRHPALWCERVMRCGAPGEINAYFALHPEADCQSYFRYLRNDDLAVAAARGRLRFDPEAAAQCLAELATDCNILRSEICERATQGTLEVGASCRSSVECTPGARCDGAEASCGGICRRAAREGEPCDGDRCAFGRSCEDGVCRAVHREARAALEPCGPTLRPDGDVELGICGPELYCIEVCRPYLPEGAACALDGSFPSCAAGLVCLSDAAGSFECARPIIETQVGAPCDGAGRLCDRLDGLVCADGACARLEGACDAPFGAWDCGATEFCSSVTSTCVPRAELGAACGSDVECASDACRAGACVFGDCTP